MRGGQGDWWSAAARARAVVTADLAVKEPPACGLRPGPCPGPPAPPARGERSVIMAWPSETLGALLRSCPHPPGQCIQAHTHLASFQGLATTNAASTIGDTLRQPHRKPRYRGTCILCHIFNNQFCYHSIMQNVVRRRLSATIFMRQRAYIQL